MHIYTSKYIRYLEVSDIAETIYLRLNTPMRARQIKSPSLSMQ